MGPWVMLGIGAVVLALALVVFASARQAPHRACPGCGRDCQAAYCPYCGAAVAAPPLPMPAQQSIPSPTPASGKLSGLHATAGPTPPGDRSGSFPPSLAPTPSDAAEVQRLRQNLRQKSLHNDGLIDRLVQAERERRPSASEVECYRIVIEQWERDNR